MTRLLYVFPAIIIALQMISCKTATTIEDVRAQIKKDNEKILYPLDPAIHED